MKNTKPIVVVLEKGLVQGVFCEDEDVTNDVLIIDYDVLEDEPEIIRVPQRRHYHPGVDMQSAYVRVDEIYHKINIDVDYVMKEL